MNKRVGALLILCVSLSGCKLVKTDDRVIYEDQTPVTFAQVHQWNSRESRKTYTDEYGEWSFLLPVGSEWRLCIENPMDNYAEACYNGILTVDSNGSLNKKE